MFYTIKMSVAQQIEDILSELVIEFQHYEGCAVEPWEAVAPDSPEWEVDEAAWRRSMETAPQWVTDLDALEDAYWYHDFADMEFYNGLLENDIDE
jgi:hypothetical protein